MIWGTSICYWEPYLVVNGQSPLATYIKKALWVPAWLLQIPKAVSHNVVGLLLPKSIQIYPIITISWVKLYKECLPDQLANQPSPSYVTEDQDEEYKVDYIVDSQWKGCRLEYLIHWKGYDNFKHIWKSLSSLSYTKEALFNFTHAHPNALHCLNMAYLDFVCLSH